MCWKLEDERMQNPPNIFCIYTLTTYLNYFLFGPLSTKCLAPSLLSSHLFRHMDAIWGLLHYLPKLLAIWISNYKSQFHLFTSSRSYLFRVLRNNFTIELVEVPLVYFSKSILWTLMQGRKLDAPSSVTVWIKKDGQSKWCNIPQWGVLSLPNDPAFIILLSRMFPVHGT
jgi:hypothetical protein